MRILIVKNGVIPVQLYGGTERVIWGLGKELSKLGHEVTFLVKEGSYCEFAKVIHIQQDKSILDQISSEYDLIHFNFKPKHIESFKIPYIITQHGNANEGEELDKNTVFVSKNHAARHNSTSFVYNGLDWEEYSVPNLKIKKDYFHFLGKAAWRLKNVQGAIDIIKGSKNEKLEVLGGVRFNIKMGLRFTLSPKIRFRGMVGGNLKYKLLEGSKGLVFPVKWHEPFGLAIIESLYYGSPVFGTPYGSLPELIHSNLGVLSNKKEDLIEAIKNADHYSSKECHEYALEIFNSKKMTLSYIEKYNKVLNKESLNSVYPKLKKVKESKFLPWT